MGRYLFGRLVASFPVLVGITIATFFVINLAPGDPISAMIDPDQAAVLGPEFLEQKREALGLNEPLPVRYGIWLKELAQGNLGFSLADRQPVTEKIDERLWPTLKLMLTALTIGVVIALPVGVLSALKQYSVMDYIVTILGFAAIAVPSFFLSLAGIYIFALKFGWLPTAGMSTVGQPSSLVDSLRHLILPATILGLAEAAPLIRYTRSGMLEVMRNEYVTVARAKGLRESTVVYGHALRNALLPLITVVALGLPRLLGGTVIVETIFSWPGMGTLAINAVIDRDYPIIMAVNLIGAVMILLSNLTADVLYALVDPRVRYA